MKSFLRIILFNAILVGSHLPLIAQENEYNAPEFDYDKGLGIKAPNDLFYLNFALRIQNRISYTSATSEFGDFDQIEARIRRMRLKFDGYVLNPKFAYKLELGFANTSLDLEDASVPNIILDAVFFYKPNSHWNISFGQTKLPGNRQRVVSSQNLEMVDRTWTNARFNIDRDFGIQVHYTNGFNDFVYALKGALSAGEGRNFRTTDEGLAYTGRIEILPLGKFTNKGDYFEADFEREPSPKISFGFTAHANMNAIRERGQLGRFLYEARDMTSIMADIMFKYNGWSVTAEYIDRNTDDPFTYNADGKMRYVYVGHSAFIKGSYLFEKNWGIASSITWLAPSEEIQPFTDMIDEYALGVSKYFKGHRLKIQSDIAYEDRHNNGATQIVSDNWQVRMQLEIGI